MSPDTDRTPTHNQSSMDATATVGDPLRGRVRTTLADASRALRTRNSSKKADSASRDAPGQSHRGGERRTVTSSSQPDASSGYQSTASEVSTQPPPSVRSTDSAIRSQSTATNIINPLRLNPVSLPTYASSCSDWQGNPVLCAERLAWRLEKVIDRTLAFRTGTCTTLACRLLGGARTIPPVLPQGDPYPTCYSVFGLFRGARRPQVIQSLQGRVPLD